MFYGPPPSSAVLFRIHSALTDAVANAGPETHGEIVERWTHELSGEIPQAEAEELAADGAQFLANLQPVASAAQSCTLYVLIETRGTDHA